MEKNKKSDTIVTAIMIGSVVIALLWMQLTDAIPYCPSGNVIDESFLNTLKVMTAVKYLVMILGMAGLFVPFIVIRLIRAKKGTRIAVIAIPCACTDFIYIALIIIESCSPRSIIYSPCNRKNMNFSFFQEEALLNLVPAFYVTAKILKSIIYPVLSCQGICIRFCYRLCTKSIR